MSSATLQTVIRLNNTASPLTSPRQHYRTVTSIIDHVWRRDRLESLLRQDEQALFKVGGTFPTPHCRLDPTSSILTMSCDLICFAETPDILDLLWNSQEADKDADLEALRGVDGIAVIVGDAEEDLTPKKGVAVQVSRSAYL